ncbi:MAG TPA: ferrous iron transport protein B [Methanomassiliicoccales archaeon]|nr:ferrous iron transport protein B [Methanomassiliicoccales archaeon]HNX47120.1 ferrous iron transport protein B [Methanomassiliicoccales archaeon]HPR98892.1 ferrous iron transport protein B [Methanomassiliicoccales archaeon]
MEVLLIGNPNVGKSVVFNRLTGVGAISSNYSGTTVDFLKADMLVHGKKMTFIDLPGIYSLTNGTEDQMVAAKMLHSASPDCVLVIADATRLEPSLVLIFQLIELGYPILVAMNMMDTARKRGELDVAKLSKILDVPIVPTVAVTGEGMEELLKALDTCAARRSNFKVSYDSHIEAYLEVMKLSIAKAEVKYPARGASIKLLEGDEEFTEGVPKDLPIQVRKLREEFRKEHDEDLEVHVNRDRYGEAGRIISEVSRPNVQPRTRGQKLSDLTMRPRTGIPILLAVLAGVLMTIIFLGSWLEGTLLSLYSDLVGTFFTDLADSIGGELGQALASGLDLSIQAILAIVIPYILLFYLILALLEDSGYLPRVVVLLDGVMHKIGLHGQAIIPMLVGMGCSVPAILATRVIESRRERLILGTIIVMAIPCSAQMAVIIGTVGNYGGIVYVLAILAILLGLVLILGRLLHKAIKFEPTSLMIEIPDLSVPRGNNILRKTWVRIKEFFVIAFPILLIGSIALELLNAYGILDQLVEPLAFFTEGWLGLPAIIIIALIFGVLRKEMSYQLLIVLFGTANLATVMTVEQLFVFALVMATFMPCMSAFAVMLKEYGLKDTLLMAASSIVLAFTLGGLANFLFQVF